jgi:hypothetical protein
LVWEATRIDKINASRVTVTYVERGGSQNIPNGRLASRIDKVNVSRVNYVGFGGKLRP